MEEIVTYHENGNIKEKYYLIDKKKEGLYEIFYDDGVRDYKINFKDDKKNGLYESFLFTGSIFERINYKDDKLEGIYESFEEDSEQIIYLECRENYKNDKLDGKSEGFSMSGDRQWLRFYRNDDISGFIKSIDNKYIYRKEKLIYSYEYKDGNIINYDRIKYNLILKEQKTLEKLLKLYLIGDLIKICSEYYFLE